jgi:hypothetical protein
MGGGGFFRRKVNTRCPMSERKSLNHQEELVPPEKRPRIKRAEYPFRASALAFE